MTVMRVSDRSSSPDFSVRLHSASADLATEVSCESLISQAPDLAGNKLRTAVASLHTNTTYIEISDLNWTEPTTVTLTPHRPGFCCVVSISTAAAIEYGYGTEADRLTRSGHVLFMLPDREISGQGAVGLFRTITCSFETEYVENIVGPLNNLSEAQVASALDVKSSLISTILLRLMHEALYPGPLSTAIVESFGHAMLVEFARCLLESATTESRGKLTARHVGIVEEYLAGLSGRSPSVAEIAGACGFSERYFAKLFREQIGCSVMQYVKSAQMAKAKALLCETDLPLKEIAYRLGFSSPANFSAAFRAATGLTPGRMRKGE